MLADTLFGVSGNGQMMIGVGILAAVVVLSNSTLRSKVSGMISRIFSGGKDTSPSDPDSIPDEITEFSQVHQVCSSLMEFFASRRDEKGIQLSAAIGQHVYQHEVNDALKAVRPVGPGGEIIAEQTGWQPPSS